MTQIVPLDRVAPALVRATGDPRWHSLDASLVSGGKSNLTFLLRSEAGELVLRRPPTGTLLPSAHDMGREARVQRALAGSGVPVAPIVLDDAGELIGAPCYVMHRVEGHVVRDELPIAFAGAGACEAMSWAFVDTLAALHDVDPAAVGLVDYGRPDGFMERQIRRWTSQWTATSTHAVAEIDELGRRLAAAVPTQQRGTVVHGDYRLDNVVLDLAEPGTIRAVLDWELSTLGDPLADLGLLMLFWAGPGEPALSLVPGVTDHTEFPDRDAVLARYAASSNLDLAPLAFYRAFAHFKFAVILQGVSARSTAGAMGGQDFGSLDHEILQLGHRGLELV